MEFMNKKQRNDSVMKCNMLMFDCKTFELFSAFVMVGKEVTPTLLDVAALVLIVLAIVMIVVVVVVVVLVEEVEVVLVVLVVVLLLLVMVGLFVKVTIDPSSLVVS
jgi:hypothetical protein